MKIQPTFSANMKSIVIMINLLLVILYVESVVSQEDDVHSNDGSEVDEFNSGNHFLDSSLYQFARNPIKRSDGDVRKPLLSKRSPNYRKPLLFKRSSNLVRKPFLTKKRPDDSIVFSGKLGKPRAQTRVLFPDDEEDIFGGDFLNERLDKARKPLLL